MILYQSIKFFFLFPANRCEARGIITDPKQADNFIIICISFVAAVK